MDITIKASDGRLFNGTNFEALEREVNAYEVNLELKRLEQEAKRKKAEEERKTKEEAESADWNKVIEAAKYFNKVASEFGNNYRTAIGYTWGTDGVLPRKIVTDPPFSRLFR